jgi:hypothetical protein
MGQTARNIGGMSQEVARYWQHPGLPGVDLLRARFVRQRYSRHTHETYVIALIDRGVEEFDHQGIRMRAGPGEIILVNPDTVHTGHAGIPDGWTYRVFYPAAELVARAAAELLAPPGSAVPTGRGCPYFPDAVVSDPVCSRLLGAAHLAAAESDELAASSMLHAAVATLLTRHAAGPRGPGGRRLHIQNGCRGGQRCALRRPHGRSWTSGSPIRPAYLCSRRRSTRARSRCCGRSAPRRACRRMPT